MTFHTAGNIGGSVHAVRDNMDPTQPRDSKCKRCPLAIFIALFLHRKKANSKRSRLGFSFSFPFLLVFIHFLLFNVMCRCQQLELCKEGQQW